MSDFQHEGESGEVEDVFSEPSEQPETQDGESQQDGETNADDVQAENTEAESAPQESGGGKKRRNTKRRNLGAAENDLRDFGTALSMIHDASDEQEGFMSLLLGIEVPRYLDDEGNETNDKDYVDFVLALRPRPDAAYGLSIVQMLNEVRAQTDRRAIREHEAILVESITNSDPIYVRAACEMLERFSAHYAGEGEEGIKIEYRKNLSVTEIEDRMESILDTLPDDVLKHIEWVEEVLGYWPGER